MGEREHQSNALRPCPSVQPFSPLFFSTPAPRLYFVVTTNSHSEGYPIQARQERDLRPAPGPLTRKKKTRGFRNVHGTVTKPLSIPPGSSTITSPPLPVFAARFRTVFCALP